MLTCHVANCASICVSAAARCTFSFSICASSRCNEVYRVLLFISPSEEAQKLALLLPQFGERTLESVLISEQPLVRPLLPLAFQLSRNERGVP